MRRVKDARIVADKVSTLTKKASSSIKEPFRQFRRVSQIDLERHPLTSRVFHLYTDGKHTVGVPLPKNRLSVLDPPDGNDASWKRIVQMEDDWGRERRPVRR